MQSWANLGIASLVQALKFESPKLVFNDIEYDDVQQQEKGRLAQTQ